MNKKKQALIITLLFITVLVLVAMNSTIFSAKIDITETQVFSITEGSKKIMRQLPEEMRFTYFLTEKLKTYSVVFRQIEDILKQYAASSDGKIKLDIVDPSLDPEMEKLATQNGIHIGEQGAREDRTSSNVFMAASGLLIEYQDKKYPFPVIQSIKTLEYDLTAYIQSIIQDKTKKLAYMINKENWDNGQFESLLQAALEPGITSKMLTPGMPVPEDTDALLVISTPELVGSELYEIDQYIMRGGKVMFMVDTIQQAQPPGPYPDAPLAEMIEGYGAKILEGYVMETEEALLPIQTEQGSLTYNYFFQAFGQNASKDNPITANFTPTIFALTSPIELTPPLGVEAEKLLLSTERAVKVMDNIEVNMQMLDGIYESLKAEADQVTLAVALKGSFPSYFQGKDIPDIKKSASSDIIYNSNPSRMLVIGNSNFLDTNFIAAMGLYGKEYFSVNLSFFQTCMEWLTNSEDLVAIKTRSSGDKSLGKILDEDDYNAWSGFATYFNLIFVPLIVVLFGIIRYLIRKKAKDEK